jgi:hypothetical protein
MPVQTQSSFSAKSVNRTHFDLKSFERSLVSRIIVSIFLIKYFGFNDLTCFNTYQVLLILIKKWYLGFGLFLTAFLPYFLHLKPSSNMSTSVFVLNPIQMQHGSFVFVLLASFPLGSLLQEILC